MSQFAGVVQELTTNKQSALSDDERAKFQSVLDYRWKMHPLYAYLNLDLDNLEHLFSLIDMETSLKPGQSEPQALRDNLIYVLVKTLELTLLHAPGYQLQISPFLRGGIMDKIRMTRINSVYVESYSDFVSHLRAHDTIVTFNYDTVLEDAMLVHYIGPDYCIEGKPTWWKTDPNVPVLKLHGSSNFVEKDDGALEIVDHERLEHTTDHYYKIGKPLLIPPTWNKRLLQGTIREIWSMAGEALRSASRIVFIGYSLPETDLSFRYLLADSVADNAALRNIFVIDPAETTMQRYESFISEPFKRQGKLQMFRNRVEDGLPSALYET